MLTPKLSAEDNKDVLAIPCLLLQFFFNINPFDLVSSFIIKVVSLHLFCACDGK